MSSHEPERSGSGRLRDRPHLVFLSDDADFDGRPFGRQPILFAADGTVIWPVTAWLRDIREFGRSEATVEQYAKRMARFFTVLSQYRGGLDWKAVDDNVLKAWSIWSRTRKEKAISDRTWNDELSTVLNFYFYAQHKGWVESIIGQTDIEKGVRFPIGIILSSGRGSDKSRLSHHLHVRTTGKSEIPYVPEAIFEEITAEFAAEKRSDLAERNIIMVDWALQTTIRRSEVVRLQCKQIPSLKRILKIENEYVSTGSVRSVSIIISRSKRGGERTTQVPLELLRRTREWIDGPRTALLATKKKRKTVHKMTDDVFISAKTGTAIKSQSFTNAFRKAAVRADLRSVPAPGRLRPRNVRLHDTRHSAITNLMAGFMAGGMNAEEAILTVKELAGHRSYNSTAAYMHLAKKAAYERSSEAIGELDKRNDRLSQKKEVDHRRMAEFAAARTTSRGSFRQLYDNARSKGLSPEDIEQLVREAAEVLANRKE